jgi:RimJ/RimL family protein N-acetyltransferase
LDPRDSLLRPAGPSDIRRLFDLRNDPLTVSVSSSRREVSWEEHESWFQSVIGNPRHLIYVVNVEHSVPVGTVRLEWKSEDTAVISIALAPSHTGRGLGPRAIDEACREAFDHWPAVSRILAHIRIENRRSIAAFSRSGFVPAPMEESVPEGHLTLVRSVRSS